MFLGEEKGKRINMARAEELAATGAAIVGVACPFCQSMFRDALPAVSEKPPKLMDIAQIADSMETVAGNHMVLACQSVEREPPPDRGIRALAVVGLYPQPSRRLPLRIEGARSRAPRGSRSLGLGSPDGSVSGGLIPRGALVHSLAGGLEVWRACVPVLPTRCRSCAGDDAVRGGGPRVETPPPRSCGRRRRVTTSRTRPRGRLRRRGARASRTPGAFGPGEMDQRPGALPVQRVSIPGGRFSMVRHG